MIYGHDDQSTEPQQLREIMFRLSADQLRCVAAFLTARAVEIEAGTFVEGGRHLCDEGDHPPGFDVIVVPPLAG